MKYIFIAFALSGCFLPGEYYEDNTVISGEHSHDGLPPHTHHSDDSYYDDCYNCSSVYIGGNYRHHRGRHYDGHYRGRRNGGRHGGRHHGRNEARLQNKIDKNIKFK